LPTGIEKGPAKRRPFLFGLPPLATLVVLAAVATMIGLGFWQLARAGEKEAALARFEASAGLPAVPLPAAGTPSDRLPLFRRSSSLCFTTGPSQVLAGRNRRGVGGFIHRVECRAEGPRFVADIGWSDRPNPVRWSGGEISGVIAPDRRNGFRLVADRGLAGLAASAPPDIASIPNNHRSYAFQWFAFALTALVIFGLALKARGSAAR
jgi:surfeit locus 1 family protein